MTDAPYISVIERKEGENIDFEQIGLKVGLEIHQQLDTKRKLFCKCKPIDSDEYVERFSRSLSKAKSELDKLDPTSEFEYHKEKKFNYYANPQSSCLVEKDEEPPHDLAQDAKNVALRISSMLGSKIFTELHVMRKTVTDGSNTSGFQRTMLVSQGGNLRVNGKNVGVQAVCLEEDAAAPMRGDDVGNERNYSLDRLGVPLVEIALEPVSTKPSEVKDIALTLGRLLRATEMVKRGIGTIRQDVNISVMNGKVVEVKGVQRLDQLEKVIRHEAKRQYGLILIAEKLKKIYPSGITITKEDVFDVTEIFKANKALFWKNTLAQAKTKVKAIRVRNFAGMFQYEVLQEKIKGENVPRTGIMLQSEIEQQLFPFALRHRLGGAETFRASGMAMFGEGEGIGPVLNSDFFVNEKFNAVALGLNDDVVDQIRKHLELVDKDGLLLIVGEDSKLGYVIDSIIKRIQDATKGVPAETRGIAMTPNLIDPTVQGLSTVFLRPRPGASRMYPETDVPFISVLPEEIKIAGENIPKSWDESIAEIQQKYDLNPQLSEQIFDSEYMELFEKICENKKNSPNFVASILCSSITNLERQGLDATLLKTEHIIESFELLASGKIPKESLEIIFENIMSGKSENVSIAMQYTDVSCMDEDELNDVLDKIIQNNMDLVKERGEQAVVTLMGIVMKEVRGKASGKMVNDLLRKKISEL